MAARTGIFAAQTSRVWRGRTWRFVLLLFMLVMAMGYVQTCLAFWGHDAAELPSAATAWIGNHAVMQTPVFGLFAYFLMVPCSSAIFADSLLLDVRSRRANALAARSSERGYVISSAALAFASAFAIVLAALLLSQALAYLAFPATASQDAFSSGFNTSASYAASEVSGADGLLLGVLRAENRPIFNLLMALYEALWSGIMALVAFAISLYVKRSRILVLGVPTLVLLVMSNFLPSELNVMATYLGLGFTWHADATVLGFLGLPALVLAAACVAIAAAFALRRDVLL